MTLKAWAKSLNISDASISTISAYAHVLMIINFLQIKGVVPNLQALAADITPRMMCEGYDVTYLQDISQVPKSTNTQSLGELLVEFFHYYGHQFRFTSSVVSVRTAGILSLTSKLDEFVGREGKFVFIEDPFKLDHNLGRNVDKGSKCPQFSGSLGHDNHTLFFQSSGSSENHTNSRISSFATSSLDSLSSKFSWEISTSLTSGFLPPTLLRKLMIPKSFPHWATSNQGPPRGPPFLGPAHLQGRSRLRGPPHLQKPRPRQGPCHPPQRSRSVRPGRQLIECASHLLPPLVFEKKKKRERERERERERIKIKHLSLSIQPMLFPTF